MKKSRIPYPDMTSTASASETTGMMPTVPDDDAELESYQQLSGMEVPKRGSLDGKK